MSGSQTPIRVLLVDDHEILREALAEHLAQRDRFDVVDSVSDPSEAIVVARRAQPDVLLLDIEMPGLDAFAAAAAVARDTPATRILFLSAFCRDRYIEQALSVGAKGYLLKGEAPSVLHEAIERVALGGLYFSEAVEARLVVGADGLRVANPGATRVASLTQREREVLAYIAKGLAKKEVAELIGVSVRTIDAHVRNIMNKLDVHDRVELARFAIREGLVPE